MISDSKNEQGKVVGAAMVVGGGVAGVQAALDLADAGIKVYLVEKSPSIGGTMARLDKTFPTNDCSMCILAPKLVDVGRHHNIEMMTWSEVEGIEGEPGNFKVQVRKKARSVNMDLCTGCGACFAKCPSRKILDEFNAGLQNRRAIYVPFPQAVPNVPVIDRAACLKFTKDRCGNCEKVCSSGAIDFTQEDEVIQIEVGAVLASPGFEAFDPGVLGQYGYDQHKNVITSLEFERFLSPTGPTKGHVVRPSDGEAPKKIAFFQCIGSRDRRLDRDYCSSVCCMYATKEAVIAKEHAPDVAPTIFYMDMRCFGKDFEQYYQKAKNEHGIKYVRSRVSRVEPGSDANHLLLIYEQEDGKLVKEEFDMVVLSVGLDSPKQIRPLADALGLSLNRYGLANPVEFDPLNSGKEGIFVSGAFQGPKDVPETVMQASAAASKMLSQLSSARGDLASSKTYPDEIPVLNDPPRIGVFVCHCGINIGSIVDVPSVAEYAKTLPHVAFAYEALFTCAQDTQELIKEKIAEHHLNRIVVAACSPRTHQPLFQETMKECGLNPGLFEMANIRDQCSWVHQQQKDEATDKSKDLVRMAVRKAALLEPLHPQQVDVVRSALVIGAGLGGMTAALALAEKGFPVTLVEKDNEPGGLLRQMKYTIYGGDVPAMYRKLISRIEADSRITLLTGAKVTNIKGFVGNFESVVAQDDKEITVKHGVVIVATGALEKEPEEYQNDASDRIVTQRELEERLALGDVKDLNSLVMIQCVGSREDDRPYCSRICCQEAVKNVVKLKELKPDARVYVLYRDIRTYGYLEEYYSKARDLGVLFIRFEKEQKPALEVNGDGSVNVRIYDPISRQHLVIPADAVALSMATVPNPANATLAQMLKVPLNSDKFFLEAHMKLRPVDFATDGVFVCGLAHAPKLIDETISQAEAAAGRAAVTLSRDYIETEINVSSINPMTCKACGLCVALCPYQAIQLSEETDRYGKYYAIVNPALCKGCGVCVSSCRCDAADLRGFTDREIVTQMMGLF